MTASLFVRLTTTFVGLCSSILTVNLLTDSSGNEIYAVFVVVTSVPSLIPFADFGLGRNVFNFYVDKPLSDRPGLYEKNFITRVFFYIVLSQLILLTVTSIIIFAVRPLALELKYWDGNSSIFIFINLMITFIAVPFSIGAKKMQAEGKISYLIVIQGLIPVIVFFSLYLGFSITQQFQSWMLTVPSFGYLLTTLTIFFHSGLHHAIQLPNAQLIWPIDKRIFSLGFWALTMTTIYSIIWQFPKYFFSATDNPDSVARYAILLMFLLPQLAIINVVTSWYSPLARRFRLKPELRKVTLEAIWRATLLSFALILITAPTLFVLRYLGLPAPDNLSAYIAISLLLTTPFWVVSMGAISEVDDFKWLSMRILPFFIALVVILNIFKPSGYSNLLFFFFIPVVFFSSATLLSRIYKISRDTNLGLP